MHHRSQKVLEVIASRTPAPSGSCCSDSGSFETASRLPSEDVKWEVFLGRGECPYCAPPPLSRRVPGNFLSGVGCGVPYDGLTHDDLAVGEVADAESSPRVVSVGVEHDALGPAWRQLVLGFGSSQVSNGTLSDGIP